MRNRTQLLTTLLTPAVALALMSLVTSSSADTAPGMEKCYGVAKAGQNDCDLSPGAGPCLKSVIDADPNYWIYVPSGVCNRIFGGLSKDEAGMGLSSTTNSPSTTVISPSTVSPASAANTTTSTTTIVTPTASGTSNANVPANNSPGPGLDSNFMFPEPKNTP